VTPKSFLTYIDNYKVLYTERLDNINLLANRMSSGLNKLIDAAAQVDILRKELESTQEEIVEKNIQVEAVSSFMKYLLPVLRLSLSLFLSLSDFSVCTTT